MKTRLILTACASAALLLAGCAQPAATTSGSSLDELFLTRRSVRSYDANEIGDGWGAYDNGLANAYLILKARDMGFDTLIMGYRDSAGEPNTPIHKSLDEIVKFF